MSRFFGLGKYDPDAPGVAVSPETASELRRVANLFLVSGITLALFVLRAAAEALDVTIVPQPVYVIWGLVMLTGWAMTLVYGVYVTFTARSWGWLVLCAIPFTCVPAAVAYAWIRRQDVEREVLAAKKSPPRSPRARGGRRP
jgi:hypothetical protein